MNYIITGSNGWISKNFIQIIKKNLPEANIYEINRKNGLLSIMDLVNKRDIYLIHNVFIRAEKLHDTVSPKKFVKESNDNLDIVNNFLQEADVSGLFYPSSGSVYKIRGKDKNLYSSYSEQKRKEEDFFIKLCKEKNIKAVVPRIFSSIGPYLNNPLAFPLSSFIIQAMSNNKINITSKNNNLYSFCSLYNLINVVLSYFSQCIDRNNKYLLFDAVDYEMNLYEMAKRVARIYDIKVENINYDFEDSNVEQYIGSPEKYSNLKQEFNLNYKSFNQDLESFNSYLKEKYSDNEV